MKCKICKTQTNTILKSSFTFFKCPNCKAVYKGFSFLKKYGQNSEDHKLLTEANYYNKNLTSRHFLKSLF